MFALNPVLAGVALWPVPFVVLVAARYGRRARPALQEVQQRIAELTAEAEENVSGAGIFQILDRGPEMTVPEGAPALPPGDGHVELRGVSVSYEGARDAALRDIDLDVPAGTTIALVGTTASGKTTLVSLIPRLYDATEGEVLVDGADVREVQLESLRDAAALVTDDPSLSPPTVHAHTACATPEASR